jgi:hypothetical protein
MLLSTAGPLLGVVLGFLIAGRNEAKRDERADNRAREERDQARQAASDAASDDFERQTLRELYGRLSDLARAMSVAYYADRKAAEMSPFDEYGSKPLSHEISNDLRLASRDVYQLRLLVLVPKLRSAVETAHLAAASVHAARDAEHATELLEAGVFAIDDAQQLIAARLRSLYVPGGDRVLADG